MKNGPHQRPVLFASAHSPTNATGAVSASAFDGSEIEPVVEQVVFDRAPLDRADIAGDALRARNTALIDGRTAHAGLPRATSKQRAPSTRVSSQKGKDADADVPLLQAAREEYGKLGGRVAKSDSR